MSEQIGRIYEFGDFRLDTEAKTLLRVDQPVPLTPKVFETLQFFLEHAGRLLEKDELMQGIWQDRFVEESNLTFNIKMLRKALQDDAQRPRFIETVPRRGYRFIAEVKQSTPGSTAQSATSPAQPPKTRNIYWAIAGAVLVMSTLFFVAWWRFTGTQAANTSPIFSTPFKSEKLSNTGSVHAVLTPDGKYVAYINESGGKQSIWLRQLETSENIQIVPPSDGVHLGLDISHDGNSLYFVRRDPANERMSALYRVNTFGGIPVKVTEQTEGWFSVSPDDKRLSFVRCKYQVEDYCSLFVADADGKNERMLIRQVKPTRITDSQFTRDGRSVVFASGQSLNGGKDFHLLRVDLTNGAVSQVSPIPFFVINRIESLPNDAFLFSARETLDSKSRIYSMTSTGEIRALTNDGLDYNDLSLSGLGDKMVATQITNSFRVQLASLNDLNNPKSLIAARTVSFAPDGSIVYSGDDGDVWSIKDNGSEQRQLTNNASYDFAPRVSPNGIHIYFTSNRSGSNQIWRMNADGSNQVQITQREGGFPLVVSPDEKFVYFYSALHQSLWRVALDTGEEVQVSEKAMQAPACSSDGKLAAYFVVQPNVRSFLEVMSLETRAIVRVIPLEGERMDTLKITWSSDSKSVYYLLSEREQKSLWQLDPTEAKPRLIANMGTDQIDDIATSPNGQQFAFVRGKWIHDAVLIEGFK